MEEKDNEKKEEGKSRRRKKRRRMKENVGRGDTSKIVLIQINPRTKFKHESL